MFFSPPPRCYNGYNHKNKEVSTTCKCTRADYEWWVFIYWNLSLSLSLSLSLFLFFFFFFFFLNLDKYQFSNFIIVPPSWFGLEYAVSLEEEQEHP